MIDYLIVGQGIAGSILADRLIDRGKKVKIIDRGLDSSATRAASGIINPITGRSFVKSWQYDALIFEAKKYYAACADKWSVELIKNLPLWRTLHNVLAENKWYARSGDPGYEGLMGDPVKPELFAERLHEQVLLGPVLEAHLVDMFALVHVLRKSWVEENILIEEDFNAEKIEWDQGGLRYGEIKAKDLILCQGYEGNKCGWFANLPLQGYRGEALTLDHPSWPQHILKSKEFMVPRFDGSVWFGSYNRKDDLGPKPTEEGNQFLKNRMRALLRDETVVKGHLCGIRPTTKDRKPLLGTHAVLRHLHIFNGLGAKGASLAPLLSKWMVDYLVAGRPLPAEVLISRF